MSKTCTFLVILFLTSCGYQPNQFVKYSAPYRPWSNAVIPFVIDEGFSEWQEHNIKDAVEEWNSRTGVSFVDRVDEFNYVLITRGEGCSSLVGSVGIGAQPIFLSPNCGYSAVLHELGHALGLIHEQQRSDRDDFVKVLWDNIEDGQKGNFSKVSQLEFPLIGEYDYYSIMHYTAYDFSNGGGPTLKFLKLDEAPKFNDVLTDDDIYKVRKLYGFEN